MEIIKILLLHCVSHIWIPGEKTKKTKMILGFYKWPYDYFHKYEFGFNAESLFPSNFTKITKDNQKAKLFWSIIKYACRENKSLFTWVKSFVLHSGNTQLLPRQRFSKWFRIFVRPLFKIKVSLVSIVLRVRSKNNIQTKTCKEMSLFTKREAEFL